MTVYCEYRDLEHPEVTPEVSAMWSRNKPSTLLREYFDVYEKENNHKCTLHRVTDACKTRILTSTAELVNLALEKTLLATPCAQILASK